MKAHGPVIDRLARDRHVVGVHHAVDEADVHPLRDQRRLPLGHGLQQREERLRCGNELGSWRAIVYSASFRRLSRSPRDAKNSNVPTRMWLAATRVSTAPGSGRLAIDRLAGGRDGERAGRGNAERVHRLADQHLAQHRTDGGLAVAAAGERRSARALEGDVATASLPVDHLAEQQCAAVAELRREATELVPGVRLSQRFGTFGHRRCRRRHRRPRGGIERRDVEAQVIRQQSLKKSRRGSAYDRRAPRDVEPLEFASVGIVETECGDEQPWTRSCRWRESERLRATMPCQGR